MGMKTGISWCHHTHNIWWGCIKVAEECRNCYAETLAKRYGFDVWGPVERRMFGPAHNAEPFIWNKAAEKAGERRRVFCGSMMDIFEDLPALVEPRKRALEMIEATPWLDWLLLTKRPENAPRLAWEQWPDNAWAGTSAGTQKTAQKNIPAMWNIKAKVRFVSAEPLLEPVSFGMSLAYIDWVIVGGESGPKCRPMSLEWARDILKQCRFSGAKFFFKQIGGHPDKKHDPEQWPEDLRIQEFPG